MLLLSLSLNKWADTLRVWLDCLHSPLCDLLSTPDCTAIAQVKLATGTRRPVPSETESATSLNVVSQSELRRFGSRLTF